MSTVAHLPLKQATRIFIELNCSLRDFIITLSHIAISILFRLIVQPYIRDIRTSPNVVCLFKYAVDTLVNCVRVEQIYRY